MSNMDRKKKIFWSFLALALAGLSVWAVVSQSKELSMKQMLDKIQFYLDHRAKGRICTGVVVFSNMYGYLGCTDTADRLIEKIQALSNGR